MSKLYYTDEAEMLAHKAWETLQLSPPVDLYRVAESLSLNICEREFDDSIDGVYVRLPEGYSRIGLNNLYTKPMSRRRFTLAHEIGHHLLSRKVNPGRNLFFVDGSKTGSTLMEKACNRFAVLLLMPEMLIKEHHEQLARNPENRLAILSDRFGVSNWAMRRRLKEIGLQPTGYIGRKTGNWTD